MSTPIFFTADLLSYIDDVLCHSVIKNVAHLCGRSRSKMWGSEGWKKIVVCVVSDGRNKVNKRTLQVLSLVCPQNSTCYATEYAQSFIRWDAIKKELLRTLLEGKMSLLISLSAWFRLDFLVIGLHLML